MSSYLTWGFESRHIHTWLSWTLVLLFAYFPLCAVIRKHQRQRITRGHGPLQTMTLDEAYAIKSWMAEHEFPKTFSAAVGIVFFKAEGIPSIAKLVARAAQRSSSSKGPPKPKPGPSATPAALLGRPGAPERQAAIDRVNYIHSLYQPSGKMSDPDLLYVLSLFALEPLRCIQRFEWRGPTAEERCALATLWRVLGEELRIPFDGLPSCETGFRDALHWLDELEVWGLEYERRNRERSPESVFLAQMKFGAWLGNVPGPCKGVVRGLLAALFEPGFRTAMGIETPSKTHVVITETIVYVRKLVRGYFCSPVALVKGYKYG
ncbi:hypothetical protein GGR51DRAFT_523464 [Nemania sp. FL0031]|nr:hypothetical protein GGR51DRAFT_523464 [Nemania sp. FL0031]